MDDLRELDEIFYILAKDIKYDLTPVQYTAYLQRTKEAKIAIENLIKARDSKRDAYIIGKDEPDRGGMIAVENLRNELRAEQRKRAKEEV